MSVQCHLPSASAGVRCRTACCIRSGTDGLLDVSTRQWQRDGLAVRGDRSDYSVSQLQLLGTRTSIAAEETAAVLRCAGCDCDCGPPYTITASSKPHQLALSAVKEPQADCLIGAHAPWAVCCRNPVSITLGGVALALAVGILVDWRRTLQYIGTGGLLFSALVRTTSYSKPQVCGHCI